MREGAHETEPIDKCRTIHREGMNQVGEILPLHGADVLQSGDAVISNFESLFLDACEPAREAREIERRLLPSVHQNHRTRCRELGAATLCQNRDGRWQYRGCSHLPFERRGNQCAAASRHRFLTDRIILLFPSAFTSDTRFPSSRGVTPAGVGTSASRSSSFFMAATPYHKLQPVPSRSAVFLDVAEASWLCPGAVALATSPWAT